LIPEGMIRFQREEGRNGKPETKPGLPGFRGVGIWGVGVTCTESQRYIYPLRPLSLLRNDDNMAIEYTFTTESGWRVREYRPFSASYAVMHTPCLIRYPGCGYQASRTYDDAIRPADGLGDLSSGGLLPGTDPGADLLASLAVQQVNFDYLSWDIIRRMVEERVRIRDKNRREIMGRVTDLSGDIYCCHLLKTADSLRRQAALEKVKLDLEHQARDEDVNLWRDLTELRRDLITAGRKYEGTRMRSGLIGGLAVHDGDKTAQYTVGPGHVSGA